MLRLIYNETTAVFKEHSNKCYGNIPKETFFKLCKVYRKFVNRRIWSFEVVVNFVYESRYYARSYNSCQLSYGSICDVPDLRTNFVAIRKITDRELELHFRRDTAIIADPEGIKDLRAEHVSDLYYILEKIENRCSVDKIFVWLRKMALSPGALERAKSVDHTVRWSYYTLMFADLWKSNR